jgi:hypothetical protein
MWRRNADQLVTHPDLVYQSIVFNSDDSEDSSSSEVEERYQALRKMKFMAAYAVVNIVITAAQIYASPLYNKIPYHTSALTGADCVLELLNGHPERIQNELGVHKHVFEALIEELQLAGHGPSKHVYLEEQLSIFLYTCVTGLSLRHVCERFQHSGETVSK